MGVLLIILLTMILCSIFIYSELEEAWSSAWLGAMIGSLLSAIPILIILGVTDFDVEVKVEETKIEAINDGSSISGSFFLGSGTVEEEQYYFFIKDTPKGKVIDKVPVEDSYIIETNEGDPRIEGYGYIPSSSFGKFMFGDEASSEEYRIYVPNGTVTTKFNIDLE